MGKSSRGACVDGVLLLDKSGGMSSNLALQKVRRLLNAEKGGHTGTLDPMATGLLPLAFGEATKFSADLLDADKSYRATLKLGVTTSTGDAEGKITAARQVNVADDAIAEVLLRFVGAIEQVPPMYSALKRDGRPLYELAREGIDVERAPRQVAVRSLRRVERTGDELTLDIVCSKGTYVRVLAEDIGYALGCGAHLNALRRTRVGPLRLEESLTLETVEAMPPEARHACLRPVDTLLGSLPRVELDEALAGRFRQGQRLAMEAQPRGVRVRAYGPAGDLLGTANVTEWGVVAPERLISNERRVS